MSAISCESTGSFRTLLRSWERLSLDRSSEAYLLTVEEAMASTLHAMSDIDAMAALVEAKSVEESLKSRRAVCPGGRLLNQVGPQTWLCQLASPGTWSRIQLAESVLQAGADKFGGVPAFLGQGMLFEDKVGATRSPGFGLVAGFGRGVFAELVIPDRRFCQALNSATKLGVLDNYELRTRVVAKVEPSSGLEWATEIEQVTVQIISRLGNAIGRAK